jgi:hypothetical protein
MPGNATFPVTNARQVNLLVPSQEQFEISDQLGDLIGAKVEPERFEQPADSGLVQHLQPILKGLQGLRKGVHGPAVLSHLILDSCRIALVGPELAPAS